MSSTNTIPSTTTLIGSANERVLHDSYRLRFHSFISAKLSPSRLPFFRLRESQSADAQAKEMPNPRSLHGDFQMHTMLASCDANDQTRVGQSIWDHGKYKCAEILRLESTEDVLRVKMYESFTRVTLFLPDDFHGVVQRLGDSGRSISCSRAALYLRESNNLRFSGVVDGTEDQILVRTEKTLHVCVAGDDPLVPRTGRFRRNSSWKN